MKKKQIKKEVKEKVLVFVPSLGTTVVKFLNKK
jgi:hypothetical protein